MNLPEIMTPGLRKKLSGDEQSPFMDTHMQQRGCRRLLQTIVGKDNDFKKGHSLKQERLHMLRLFSSYSIHTPTQSKMFKTVTGKDGFTPLKGKVTQAIRLDEPSRLTLVCDKPQMSSEE
jgi:ferric iron reductase protein FhuF